MSCASCAEVFEKDGILPDCETDKGCVLPELAPAGARILKIRNMLVELHEIVDPGTICRMFDADLDDLELIASVEAEARRNQPKGKD